MTDWNEIVREHSAVVWKTALRLLGNEADANDCFQETFISALKLSRRESIQSWPAVLKRLTTARALERLRKRYQNRKQNEVLRDLPPRNGQIVHPEQMLLEQEFAGELRRALVNIDEQQARVFCLVVLEERSYSDAAIQLKLAPNHVGVLLHRAKSSLQELLENHRPCSRLNRNEKTQ